MGDPREDPAGRPDAAGDGDVGGTEVDGPIRSAGPLSAIAGSVLILVGGARPPGNGFTRPPGDLRSFHRAHRLADGRLDSERRGIRHGFSLAGTIAVVLALVVSHGRRHRALSRGARGPDPQVRGPPERGNRDTSRSTCPVRDQRRSRCRGRDHLAREDLRLGRTSGVGGLGGRRGDVRPRVHHDLCVGGREVGSGAGGRGARRAPSAPARQEGIRH